MPHGADARALLRHALATLAYRGAKAIQGAPQGFATLAIGAGARTPLDLLAHLSDVLDWGLSIACGRQRWEPQPGRDWPSEVGRFHASLAAFDAFLASDAPLEADPRRLLQGPIADALTHVGQLALMRRLAGDPIPGENFYRADVIAGRTGAGQSAPVAPHHAARSGPRRDPEAT